MRVYAIVGPTAVGKTKLSLALAKSLNGEIISCDSMQFYRGLDIGTAKVNESEMEGIKHHLIDILNPEDEFSVAEYQALVRSKIDELIKKKITPILVGGSGLFISSVLYDYRFLGDKRNDLSLLEYDSLELSDLASILKEKAPELAANTDLENRRRVLRALEKDDSLVDKSGHKLFYKDAIIFGLTMPREQLYERINQRVDQMLEMGLLKEAKWLFDLQLNTQATKAIGYKEFFPYFEEKHELSECIEILKKNSRRYAKRQFTWFRNKMDCIWLEVSVADFDSTIKQALEYINKSHTS